MHPRLLSCTPESVGRPTFPCVNGVYLALPGLGKTTASRYFGNVVDGDAVFRATFNQAPTKRAYDDLSCTDKARLSDTCHDIAAGGRVVLVNWQPVDRTPYSGCFLFPTDSDYADHVALLRPDLLVRHSVDAVTAWSAAARSLSVETFLLPPGTGLVDWALGPTRTPVASGLSTDLLRERVLAACAGKTANGDEYL